MSTSSDAALPPLSTTGTVTAVSSRPIGTSLAADVPAAATTITVVDNAVMVAGDQLQLTDVETGDTETVTIADVAGVDTVTLAAPTTNDYATSSTVARVPQGSELIAFVAIDDAEPMPVVVDHALADAFTRGVRTIESGEIVEVTRAGGELRVSNILDRDTKRPDVQESVYAAKALGPTRSFDPPPAEAGPSGAQWFQTDVGGLVEGWWMSDGTTWQPQTITGVMLAVDALDGKTITGLTISNPGALLHPDYFKIRQLGSSSGAIYLDGDGGPLDTAGFASAVLKFVSSWTGVGSPVSEAPPSRFSASVWVDPDGSLNVGAFDGPSATTGFRVGPTTAAAVKAFNHGDFVGSTNSSAQVTITHGLGAVPTSLSFTGSEAHGSARHRFTYDNLTSTTFRVTVRDSSSGLVSSPTRFMWQAWR